ncbi:MAG: hypothetical protein C0508_01325 [Cyanobacteria bacterium PR.023]|nr:hypothetical protein [Cyanobacteria bacterium PR.023]
MTASMMNRRSLPIKTIKTAARGGSLILTRIRVKDLDKALGKTLARVVALVKLANRSGTTPGNQIHKAASRANLSRSQELLAAASVNRNG